MARDNTVSVVIGEGVVTIRQGSASRPLIAKILGMKSGADGQPHTLWLDRLVHAPGARWDGDWRVGGAISSILYRNAEKEGDKNAVSR